MTVVPTLAAAPQADYEVVQPRSPDYGYTDSLPLAEIRINTSLDRVLTEISAMSMIMTFAMVRIGYRQRSAMSTEMTGGSPPAEIIMSKSPDRLLTETSVTSTEMAGGRPPAHIDICEGPDRLQTEIS